MTPDDARHGTIAGRQAGCDGECCRSAKRRYDKRLEFDRLNGRVRMVPSLGATRRLQALGALGWSAAALAPHLAAKQQEVIRWRTTGYFPSIRAVTHDRIARVYDALCMTTPPAGTRGERSAAARARAHAHKMRWHPPLAWDNIDRDVEPPTCDRDDDIDEAVVLRLLAGDPVPATKPERVEAMRRWLAWGRSERALCETHGWHEGRYVTTHREDAA